MAKGNIFDYKRVRSPDMDEVMKNIDTAFAISKSSTLTTAYTVLTTDFGKTFRVNSAADPVVTLPSPTSTYDGARLTFLKQGAGKMTIQTATGYFISSYNLATALTSSSTEGAAITLEYVNGDKRWIVVSHEGTFASTA